MAETGVDRKANVATFIKGACALKADTIQLDLYLQQSAGAEGALLSGCRKDQTQPQSLGFQFDFRTKLGWKRNVPVKKKPHETPTGL